MKRLIAGIVICLLALTFILTRQTTPEFKGFTDFTTQINSVRAGYDLNGLRDDPVLIFVAEAKCIDMVERNYTSHQDPKGDYVWKDLEPNHKYGENLAGGYYSSYETVQAWVASPTHLENIVDPVFTRIGHANCYNGQEYLTVQVFSSN